jgi:hypothetical protein
VGAYTRCIHRLLPPLLPQPVAYRRGTGSRESHPQDQHWSQNHSVGAYTRCIHRLLPPLLPQTFSLSPTAAAPARVSHIRETSTGVRITRWARTRAAFTDCCLPCLL